MSRTGNLDLIIVPCTPDVADPNDVVTCGQNEQLMLYFRSRDGGLRHLLNAFRPDGLTQRLPASKDAAKSTVASGLLEDQPKFTKGTITAVIRSEHSS